MGVDHFTDISKEKYEKRISYAVKTQENSNPCPGYETLRDLVYKGRHERVFLCSVSGIQLPWQHVAQVQQPPMTLVIPTLASIHTVALVAISFSSVCNPEAYWGKVKPCIPTPWNFFFLLLYYCNIASRRKCAS